MKSKGAFSLREIYGHGHFSFWLMELKEQQCHWVSALTSSYNLQLPNSHPYVSTNLHYVHCASHFFISSTETHKWLIYFHYLEPGKKKIDRSKMFPFLLHLCVFSLPTANQPWTVKRLHMWKLSAFYFRVTGYPAQLPPNGDDFRFFSHSFIKDISSVCHLDNFSHASWISRITEDENTSTSTVSNLYLWWMSDYSFCQNAALGIRCSRITVTPKFILD